MIEIFNFDFSHFNLWHIYLLYWKWCEVKKHKIEPLQKKKRLSIYKGFCSGFLFFIAKNVNNLEYLWN
jgi:hypothetical protein